MKATELMIGDWVMYRGEPIIVYEIDEYYDRINTEPDGYNAITCVEILDIKPIPITLEILKKNGFGYVENDVNPYNDEVLSHFYLGEEDYCANMNIHIGTYNKGVFWLSSPLGSLNCIRYIHELQHALRLCGIEKEIEV